jgi:hypothetical protein
MSDEFIFRFLVTMMHDGENTARATFVTIYSQTLVMDTNVKFLNLAPRVHLLSGSLPMDGNPMKPRNDVSEMSKSSVSLDRNGQPPYYIVVG